MSTSHPYAELNETHDRLRQEEQQRVEAEQKQAEAKEQQRLQDIERRATENIEQQRNDWQQQREASEAQGRDPPPQNEYYNSLDRRDERRAGMAEARLAGDEKAQEGYTQQMRDEGYTAAEIRSEFEAAERYGQEQAIKAEHEAKEKEAKEAEVEKDRAARLEEFLADQRTQVLALEKEQELDLD